MTFLGVNRTSDIVAELRRRNAREDVRQAAALLQRTIDRADGLHALDTASLEETAASAYAACATLRATLAR